MLREGDVAPAFNATDHNGNRVSTEDLKGSWVVLWWYPRASSGQCTTEGTGFEAVHDQFSALGAQVLGISFDTDDDNCAFAASGGFGYRLLSDPSQEIGRRYDVVRDATDKYSGLPKRRTFLIAPDGTIARIFDVTDVGSHPGQVLAVLRSIAT